MKRARSLAPLGALAAALLLVVAACGGGSTEPISVVETDQGEVSFKGTVHPILMDHCVRCHGEDADGELSILSYESLMEGGKSGDTIVPGDPDASRLVTSVEKARPPHMPPRIFPALTEDRIAAIRDWIEAGAEDD
ncbi:MAG: c-type cytochrome domain-containing protein [Polyangia bacterium]